MIVALWIAFAVTHMGPSSNRLRPRLVGALGERAFMGLYSLIALATFVPLVWVYIENRHLGAVLWAPAIGTGLAWFIYVVMGAALALIVGGVMQPSPASLGATGATEVRGVHRLTRHPVFMGIGLFGALHLIPNGSASDVAFFAGFPMFSLIGSWHQDRRKLASGDARFRAWYEQTPFLPFTGRETLRGIRELLPGPILVAVALTIVFRLLHGPLFG
jgi:uncharacterized membrane protein